MAFYKNTWFLSLASTACVAVLGVMLFTDIPSQRFVEPDETTVIVDDIGTTKTIENTQTIEQSDTTVAALSEDKASSDKPQNISPAKPISPPRASVEITKNGSPKKVTEVAGSTVETDVNEYLEEQIVIGTRSSLEHAKDIKRNADTVVDAVDSEALAPSISVQRAPALASQSAPSKKQLMNNHQFVKERGALVGKTLPRPEPLLVSPSIQESRDRFETLEDDDLKSVADEPISTFSIDVDTSAYSYVRRELNSGRLPRKDAVRIEELINYFDYDYPVPNSRKQPFEPSIVVTDSPWARTEGGKKLITVGIKGYEIDAAEKPATNLVFLLDVSGSMSAPDKLPLVKQSMQLLLSQLNKDDTVGIVVYAGAAGTVLEPTKASEKQTILAALSRLNAGGSTAGGAGIELAYQLAEQNFKKNAINRIILATDGDFNVGMKSDTALKELVEKKREKGIYLSVLGFGQGNYQDALMQTLAQNGNGNAAYIDTLSEAQKVLVHESVSTLFPIANDVKIQVEFNPATVSEYRLLGYQTRQLKTEDFNNDKVDAGDIGAGHSVTAIYEVTPVGSKEVLIDKKRYGGDPQSTQVSKGDLNNSELGFLKIRYKLPGEKTSNLITKAIANTVEPTKDKSLLNEVRFSTAVAGFAQLLRQGKFLNSYSYDDVISEAQATKGDDPYGYRTEFIQLARKAKLHSELN